MFKKTIILALAAMAVLAVSAPAASASWYKHHQVIQADQQIELTGQWKYQALAVGSIECQARSTVRLLAGQTTAHFEAFSLDTETGKTPTELCFMGGLLAQCDVTDLIADASPQSPWVAHLLQNKDTISLTTGTIQTKLESTAPGHNACNIVQQLQLKPGTLHATVASGETCTLNKIIWSGQLETQTGAKVQFGGTQNLLPGETYGTLC